MARRSRRRVRSVVCDDHAAAQHGSSSACCGTAVGGPLQHVGAGRKTVEVQHTAASARPAEGLVRDSVDECCYRTPEAIEVLGTRQRCV
eukprot:18912-Eustigmatos_ZCMA.PRE.1